MLVKRVLRSPTLFLAFGFGAGLSPKASGTVGTLVALPLVWALSAVSPLWYAGVFVLATVLGIGLCGRAARLLGVHDHGGIVWDEFLGLAVAAFLLPAGWPWWLAAFVLFRVFDVLKPWPIDWLDRRIHGGFGIVLDDLVAGLMAFLLLQTVALGLGVSRLPVMG